MALSLQDMAKTPKKTQALAKKKKPTKTARPTLDVADLINRGVFEKAEPDQIPQRSTAERVVRAIRTPLQSIGRAATLGIGGSGGLIERKMSGLTGADINPAITPETGLEKGLSIGGEIAGSAVPIGGIYKLAKPLTGLIKSTKLPARAAKAAIPGGISVGAYEGTRAATEGKSPEEIAKATLKGAALGAVGEVAGRALLKGISRLAKIPKNSTTEKEAFGAGVDIGERLDNRPKQKNTTTKTETLPKTTPIEDRTFEEVGKRSVKAYQWENPQVKPFIQGEAYRLLGELKDTIKGQKFFTNTEEGTVITGTKRLTSEPIKRILSETGATYKEVADALNRIIKDQGAENIALAKRIELVIDDNLSSGRKSIEGIDLPPDKAYLSLKGVQAQQAKGSDIDEFLEALEPTKPGEGKPVATIGETYPKTSTKPTADLNAASFREKINRTPEKKSSFKEFAENFRTQFVDDLAPLEKLEKGVRGKISSAEDSLYKTARLFRGVPTKSAEFVRSRLTPIFDSIEKNGYNYSDLGDYALAVHARDVNAKGLKSGFTDDEIKAVIEKYGTPEMEAARKELVKVSTELLDDLSASGVIEANLPKILREKWPNYMPLFRSFDDAKIEFSGGLKNSLANVTSPIKKLKGSDREVIDPIESMVKNIFQSINASERNRVVQQLGKLADEDTTGQFVRRLIPDENRDRLNTVYERVNGEKVYYEVQPDVYKAIMDLNEESAGILIKFLQKPASLLRAGATLTPEFSFRNPMRDVVQAYVVSKSGFRPFTDFPRALLNILKRDDIYKQWLSDSGGYGNIVSMDRNMHREVLTRVMKEKPSDKFVNIISGKSLIGLLRSIADVSESATKLGEYKAALRSGTSRPEAAYRSRDIMDFARAGSSTRNLNKMIAFLNANIQGKSKLLRAIREDPTKVTVRALKMVTLPSIGVYMLQKNLANDVQKQTIEDAPTWLKDTFWLIPVPGTNQVARLPKPFDLAPLFANLPERVLDYAFNKDPKAFDEFGKQTLKQFSIPVMITGIMPIIEGAANYSFFRQGPIIPEREKDLEYPDQYDIRTSEVAKGIAKGVNTITGGEGVFKNFGSPRIIDNTIRGLTAGLGTYATSAIDTILEETGAVDKPEKPSKKISEKPLIRAFLVSESASGKSMSDLYDERDRLTRAKGSAQANKQPFKEAGKLKAIDAATKQIGEITKAIRTVENSKTMSAEDKRKRIDQLNERRNNIARLVVKKLDI